MFKPPVEIKTSVDHSDRVRELEAELYSQSQILRKVRDKSTSRRNRIDDLSAQVDKLKRTEAAQRENAEAIKAAAIRAGVWPLVVDELKLAQETGK